MSEADRRRWDARFSQQGMAPLRAVGPPAAFAAVADLFPNQGSALDVACGRGEASVWLAKRGMEVLGIDVSPVAIEMARRLAEANGIADRCRLEVHDLDDGLPDGPPVDLVLCHLLRDSRLDQQLIERARSGGLVAVAALCEFGSGPGRFRAAPGELSRAFGSLEILAEGEAEGVAWLIGRRRQ